MNKSSTSVVISSSQQIWQTSKNKINWARKIVCLDTFATTLASCYDYTILEFDGACRTENNFRITYLQGALTFKIPLHCVKFQLEF